MQPMFGSEMGAARSAALREQAAHARLVKQAKAAKKASRTPEEIRTPRVVGILPWRSVARGRSWGKARTRSATQPC